MRSRSSSPMILGVVFDCFGQQVTDRDNGYGRTVLDHRQVTNAVQVHQLQTVCERLRKINFDDISDHDVRYRSKFWRLPGKHKPPHAITFGKNACDRPMLRNHDKPDVLFGHETHCRERVIPGADGPQGFRLCGKDLF